VALKAILPPKRSISPTDATVAVVRVLRQDPMIHLLMRLVVLSVLCLLSDWRRISALERSTCTTGAVVGACMG